MSNASAGCSEYQNFLLLIMLLRVFYIIIW